MTMPRPIPASVRTLLPLCGAENDHEALGACRGVGRKLQAAGLDWHDLAAAIPINRAELSERRDMSRQRDNLGAGAQSEFSRRREKPTGAGWIRPFNTYAFRRIYTPRQEAEHRARVRFCQSRPWHLTEWERGFLDNLARLHGNLSIRQGDRLAALTDRLEQEARRA
ncbi:hypothetical protein MKK67_11530 [Methylobacterium sp. J-072]|uniref:hypothetical protein n=1 Tax=Methylobacterium sp. J-072 TaxID=2836651 RepID=UPI001FB9F0CF|nr:hypothetical protein [Methylobacterium sp. J-072]MCJ2093122.1 hypothetical protein [Methylobacterium sp. J-072]